MFTVNHLIIIYRYLICIDLHIKYLFLAQKNSSVRINERRSCDNYDLS